MYDIFTLFRVAKALKGVRTASQRIARRWVVASLQREYDAMLRLQVLEGALGLPVGYWWKRGSRGLAEFQGEYGESLHPDWFDPKSTQYIQALSHTVNKKIRKDGLLEDLDDVLQSIVSGVPLRDSWKSKLIAHEVGVQYALDIDKGASPKALVGALTMYTWNMLANLHGPGREELTSRPPEQEQRVLNPVDLLTLLMWTNDPLGKAIRQKIRDVWASHSDRYGGPMLHWLRATERGERLSQAAMAKQLGMTKVNFGKYYWKEGWRDFFNAFWKDKRLQGLIQKHLYEEGIHESLTRIDPSDFLKGEAGFTLGPRRDLGYRQKRKKR